MTEANNVLHACRCSATNLTGIFQHFLATRALLEHEEKGLGGHIGSVLPLGSNQQCQCAGVTPVPMHRKQPKTLKSMTVSAQTPIIHLSRYGFEII